jgi:hypothetical protein
MKLQSDFALLDIRRGRKQLDKLIDKAGEGHDFATPIPVTIHGVITGRHGYDDGESQEFTVSVKSVEVKSS